MELDIFSVLTMLGGLALFIYGMQQMGHSLEKLGGGGNAATAGAQIRDKSVREVLTELVASIDQFYES